MPALSQTELDALLPLLTGVRKVGGPPVGSAPGERKVADPAQPPAAKRPRAASQHADEAAPSPVFQPVTSTLVFASQLAGRVIGRGGANVKGIQAMSGAAVEVQKDGDGAPTRTVTVTGLPANVLMACGMLTAVIDQAGRTGGGSHSAGGRSSGPRKELRLPCDASKLGWVLGPKGATIKAMRSLTGAKIDVLEEVSEATGRRSGVVVLCGSETEVEEARGAVAGLLGGGDESRAYAASLVKAAEERAAWDEAQAAAALPPPPLAAAADSAAAPLASAWERRTAKHPDGKEVVYFYHSASGAFSWGQ